MCTYYLFFCKYNLWCTNCSLQLDQVQSTIFLYRLIATYSAGVATAVSGQVDSSSCRVAASSHSPRGCRGHQKRSTIQPTSSPRPKPPITSLHDPGRWFTLDVGRYRHEGVAGNLSNTIQLLLTVRVPLQQLLLTVRVPFRHCGVFQCTFVAGVSAPL